MALEDWNWRLPTDPQDLAWDCAACSTAWAMRTVGYPHSEHDVIAGLGPSRITSTYGLMDASGKGLQEYLAEVGITADQQDPLSWQDVLNLGGHSPFVMGGRAWCHWVAVRLSSQIIGRDDLNAVALMNSADGYMGVEQVLYESDFARLGPFSGVWFASW